MGARTEDVLENSAVVSGFAPGHGFLDGGRFRDAPFPFAPWTLPFGHWPESPLAAGDEALLLPFTWLLALVVTVEADPLDDVDETDDDEFVR